MRPLLKQLLEGFHSPIWSHPVYWKQSEQPSPSLPWQHPLISSPLERHESRRFSHGNPICPSQKSRSPSQQRLATAQPHCQRGTHKDHATQKRKSPQTSKCPPCSHGQD